MTIEDPVIVPWRPKSTILEITIAFSGEVGFRFTVENASDQQI
jgi:hypothetical protein